MPLGPRDFTQPCERCGEGIPLRWHNGLEPGPFVLVAHWVFHPKCWEEMIGAVEVAPDEVAPCHPDQRKPL